LRGCGRGRARETRYPAPPVNPHAHRQSTDTDINTAAAAAAATTAAAATAATTATLSRFGPFVWTRFLFFIGDLCVLVPLSGPRFYLFIEVSVLALCFGSALALAACPYIPMSEPSVCLLLPAPPVSARQQSCFSSCSIFAPVAN
jgi:hypothetical protein